MRQNGNSAGLMYAVDERLHVFGSNTLGHAISEDMNVSSVKSELETGNYREIRRGERVAKRNVLPHAVVIEHFRMIADRHKVHPGPPEYIHQPIEALLAIRKHAVNV